MTIVAPPPRWAVKRLESTTEALHASIRASVDALPLDALIELFLVVRRVAASWSRLEEELKHFLNARARDGEVPDEPA